MSLPGMELKGNTARLVLEGLLYRAVDTELDANPGATDEELVESIKSPGSARGSLRGAVAECRRIREQLTPRPEPKGKRKKGK